MSAHTVDLIVAGAGPAGSSAAELLAGRGVSVALFDPKAPWEKPCGGGLTAAALRNTPDLIELRHDAQTVHELLIVAPSGAGVVIPLRTPFWVVSRTRLAQWGIDRAMAAGAAFHARGVREVRPIAGGWLVTDDAGSTHRARWLLAAAGATSRLRPLLAPQFRPGRCATRVTYPPRGSPPGRAVFRFLTSGPGYAWDFPRTDHHSIGVAVPSGRLRRADLDEVIRELRAMEGDGTPSAHQGALITTWEWEQGDIHALGAERYAVLGDAAGLADPVSDEGIDYAFRSARLAALAFDERCGFAAYPGMLHRDLAPDRKRARTVSRWFYHRGIVERLVRAARRAPKGRSAAVLAALADAMNEHQPIGRSLRQAIGGVGRWRLPRGGRNAGSTRSPYSG